MIGVLPGQIVTEALEERPRVAGGEACADPERDLAKIAVIERHLGTGRIGLGFVHGLGLRRGAIASTVAHDAHNVVVAGVDDDASPTLIPTKATPLAVPMTVTRASVAA